MSDQLPLNGLRVFEAVARLGSFTRAAEELFITQSAVSHQIKALEDWFEAPLFDRTRRLPTLLPRAQALAPVLASAFSDIHSACRRLRSSGDSQHLVVAVIPSVATCWLIPRLASFREKHPEISLRIVYAIHGVPGDMQDVDLAIVYAPDLPSAANLMPFLAGTSAPVCSASLLTGGSASPSASAIARMPLLHDTDFTGWRLWCRKTGAETPPLDKTLVFADFNLLRAATLAGQGVSICPLRLIADDLEAGRLVCLSETTVSEDSGYYFKPIISPQPPAAIRFQEWLLATTSPT